MYKKTISLIVTISIFLNVFGVYASNNTSIIEETIYLSSPVIIKNDQNVNIDFKESTSFLTNRNEPMLPYITKVYILPFKSEILDLNVILSGTHQIKLSQKVQLSSENKPLIDSYNKKNDESNKNNNYNIKKFYPEKTYSYNIGSGLDGDDHVVYLSIHCYPIRYSPDKNILEYSDKIDIRIEYTASKNSISYDDEYDLVIISPSIFSNSLQQLIDHKNNYNVKTNLVTTEEILGEYQGRDDPEQIKYFIKNTIENWNAKYILLIGDMDLMPMRVTDMNVWSGLSVPTDLYYADIYDHNGNFCNWDFDNDNKFGEYEWEENGNIDRVDLYADIKIGRIPCKNNYELKTTIKKIIIYETQTYGQDWFNNAILMGGDTFPNHGPLEGEIVTYQISQQIPEFNNKLIWTSEGNYNPININKQITDGAGFISYSGHGYTIGFGTSPPNDENRIEYYTPYSIGMLNKDKYSIIFFDACLTASIDLEILGFKFPCFAWYLIAKPIGGAVATIGATRVAFTNVNSQGIHGGACYLNYHFFKAYEPGITVSEMLVSSQNDYLNAYEHKDCFTIEEFILLGDPSLKVGGYPIT